MERYIADVELYKDGQSVKWVTVAFENNRYDYVGDVANHIREQALNTLEYYVREEYSARIVGVFKL